MPPPRRARRRGWPRTRPAGPRGPESDRPRARPRRAPNLPDRPGRTVGEGEAGELLDAEHRVQGEEGARSRSHGAPTPTPTAPTPAPEPDPDPERRGHPPARRRTTAQPVPPAARPGAGPARERSPHSGATATHDPRRNPATAGAARARGPVLVAHAGAGARSQAPARALQAPAEVGVLGRTHSLVEARRWPNASRRTSRLAAAARGRYGWPRCTPSRGSHGPPRSGRPASRPPGRRRQSPRPARRHRQRPPSEVRGEQTADRARSRRRGTAPSGSARRPRRCCGRGRASARRRRATTLDALTAGCGARVVGEDQLIVGPRSSACSARDAPARLGGGPGERHHHADRRAATCPVTPRLREPRARTRAARAARACRSSAACTKPVAASAGPTASVTTIARDERDRAGVGQHEIAGDRDDAHHDDQPGQTSPLEVDPEGLAGEPCMTPSMAT